MSTRPIVAEERRAILTLGGGGFTMEPDNPALDELVHDLTAAREPHVLFLPTASGDPASQINAFRARFGGRACVAEHLSLSHLHGSVRTLEEIVLSHDVIYAGGGSMRNLLRSGARTGSTSCWSKRGGAARCLPGSAPGRCAGSRAV